MMSVDNAEDSVEDNIYHYDFTTASSWEIFMARIEEIVYQWKLSTSKGKKAVTDCDFNKLSWTVQTEEAAFAECKFALSWHRGENIEDNNETEKHVDVLDETMCTERDFCLSHHPIVFQYGLSEFVVLEPLNVTLSHSKLNTLLSAVTIALTNTQCQVPIFVKALDLDLDYYVGIACSQINRIHFDSVRLRKVPQQCQYLSGLINIFKSNLKRICSKDLVISVKLAYTLENLTLFRWSQKITDWALEDISEIRRLTVGSYTEPIYKIEVSAVWSGLPEGTIVDGPTYTDLDPCRAPTWKVVAYKQKETLCALTRYLIDFFRYCSFSGTNYELLGDLISLHGTSEYCKPFKSITESRIPKLSDLIFSNDTFRRSVEEPIPRGSLLSLLYYLFPDTEDSRRFDYKSNDDLKSNENTKFKTCQEDGLVWRLAAATGYVLHSLGGNRAAAHLWHEFIQELRFRWNSVHLIPGIASGEPDTKTCLLHQKLQMINCCIQRKIDKEKETNKVESDEEEEEFYACESEEDESKTVSWNLPAGRLEKHPTLKLLDCDKPLYIPVLQPHAPKTEDQLIEDERALTNLGSSEEASHTRAKLMSPFLLSHAESFKAANPESKMEDFIRWISPRDWIEKEVDGVIRGELSERMSIPGNMWSEIWSVAKPVPSNRQKRLFNETREAERALHFLESSSPSETASLLLPVILHIALDALENHVREVDIDTLTQAFDKISKKFQQKTRGSCISANSYQDIVTDIELIECILSQIKSLEFKFGVKCGRDDGRFIRDLVLGECQEAVIPGGADGDVAAKIKTMFVEAYKVEQMLDNDADEERVLEFNQLIRPSFKNFVIRIRDSDVAQRLTVHLSPDEIKMSCCSTQSTLLC